MKKQIKDWHTSVVQRKNQEWLIVHIVRPDNKAAANRIFQIKTSVLDKIKADFNVEKRDRCVVLIRTVTAFLNAVADVYNSYGRRTTRTPQPGRS